jgi:hypothetical protein
MTFGEKRVKDKKQQVPSLRNMCDGFQEDQTVGKSGGRYSIDTSSERSESADQFDFWQRN